MTVITANSTPHDVRKRLRMMPSNSSCRGQPLGDYLRYCVSPMPSGSKISASMSPLAPSLLRRQDIDPAEPEALRYRTWDVHIHVELNAQESRPWALRRATRGESPASWRSRRT